MSLTVPIAEWLERHDLTQGVADSISGGGIYFQCEFFAYFPLFIRLGEDYRYDIKYDIKEINLILKILRRFI